MATPELTKTVYLDADAATVWRYLTNKDKLALWFQPPDNDLAVGEDYVLRPKDGGDGKCWGKVLEAKPNDKLVFTFTFDWLDGNPTNVTWQLEEMHGGTRLTLHHDGVAEAAGEKTLAMLTALDAGWDAHFVSLREQIN